MVSLPKVNDMNEQQNIERIKESFERFGTGDVKGLVDHFTDDAELVFAGGSGVPWSGTYRGHAGVEQWLSRVERAVDYEAFEPLEYVAQRDKVVVLGREAWTAKGTTRRCEQHWCVVFTMQSGKIARARSFEDTAAVSAAIRG